MRKPQFLETQKKTVLGLHIYIYIYILWVLFRFLGWKLSYIRVLIGFLWRGPEGGLVTFIFKGVKMGYIMTLLHL
jgi:hypothetical protein